MKIKVDRIIRSKRKTIGLEVTSDAKLIVRAPYRFSNKEIKEIVIKKSSWILRKQKFFHENDERLKGKEFIDGEDFLYLGKILRLNLTEKSDTPLSVNQHSLTLSKNYANNAEGIIRDWYKEQANKIIPQRVEHYSSLTGLKYNRINMTNASKRWGSCSANGNLNFTWRLILAPLRVIDYVIVHELAHLEVKNHSREFWHRVAEIIPDYKQDKNWLRENGFFCLITY